MKLFKRGALVVLALVAIGLFGRGQGYEWTWSTEDAAKFNRETIVAIHSCYSRYNETTEYDLLLRCKADADKLIRDQFKWW
jgi:hypothetical protein